MPPKKPKHKTTQRLTDSQENAQIVQQQATNFFSKDVILPQEIYFLTLSFLPAFPTYFQLRRVNKAWKAFLEKMYDLVDELNLLPHTQISDALANKVLDLAVLDFLRQVVPNVKRLVVPLHLWTKVRATSVNARMEAWKDLELHIFPCKNDASEWFNVEELPQVKAITFYSMVFAPRILYGNKEMKPATKLVLKYPYVHAKVGIPFNEADLHYPFVKVENFTDLENKEQFTEYCKYFIGT